MQPQITIQGDQVQGDHIEAKIDNAQNVIVGKDNTVTYNTYQMPPLLRTPMQRPPRAEHFQDRKEELAQLLNDLQPGKVVTVCGPGGMGKTALAAEVVGALSPHDNQSPERFPDGILFYSFYGQGQVAVALEHIVRSFGEELKPTPKAAAQRALAGRRVLLILDGTEEADDLPALLAIRNQCGVLITSRLRKDALAERHDLPPLPAEESVTLLQAWGGQRAADPAAVQQICQLVGRLPLALRLVGRYLAQNEENASDYLAWLTETPLTALDQGQRQLESAPLLLDRSVAQVSERARQVLGVVGLLASAPFERAVIAKALALSERESRQALGELVDYGLLTRPTEQYEVTHALIHTYASQQLAPSDEVVVRLGDYFRQKVDTHNHDFAYLHLIRPHIMTLLSIASERKSWDAVSDLAWSIDNYLDIQGYWTERKVAITLNLTAACFTQDRPNESALLSNMGNVSFSLGQVEQALDYYQRSLTIAKEIGDRKLEGMDLDNLGSLYYSIGQIEQSINYHQQALTIAKEIGDRKGEGADLGNLGLAYLATGELDRAIDCYNQALVIAKEIGDIRSEGNHLGHIGLVYADRGQVEEAVNYYQQALTIAQKIGDRSNEGKQLGNLGNVYADRGQVEKAIDCYQQALTIAQKIGDRSNEGNQLGNLGGMYADMGHIEKAIQYHQQALAIAKEIGDRGHESTHLGNLGLAYAGLGRMEQAINYYQQAIAIAREMRDRKDESRHLGNLGVAYINLGQTRQALECYHQALSITREIGYQSGEGVHLGNLGSVYWSLGMLKRAIGYYQQALIIAKETGDRKNEGTWLGNLGNVYHNLDQVDQARQHYQQALQIFESIKSPNAATVREQLESLEK